MKNKRIEQEA